MDQWRPIWEMVFGTGALIEALRRSFFDAIHVEEMWHSDWAAVSKIRCFQALQMLRTPFSEDVALATELQQPFTDGLGREALRPSKPLAGGRLKRSLSYSNSGDKRWHVAAPGGTERIRTAISERGAAIC